MVFCRMYMGFFLSNLSHWCEKISDKINLSRERFVWLTTSQFVQPLALSMLGICDMEDLDCGGVY